jgi:uncharacterized protein YaaR (DUF327 family)
MTKSTRRYLLLLLISIITVVSLTFSITTPVLAQKDNPGKSGENQGQGQEKALSKLFERLLTWQLRQEQQFQQAEYISQLLEDFIENSNTGGLDTSLLVEDLKAFKNQIKEARKSYQLAQLTLATHYGINQTGEVYSVKSTRQMIKVASRSFGESHKLLTQSVKAIMKSVRDWQVENGGASTALDTSELPAP